IGLAVDVAVPETPETEALAEEFRRPALERAVIDLLASIEDTLVLTVEDAHWMDEASGDLLRRMSVEAADRPWLICVTRRDEDTGFAAPEGSHVRTLRPEPLGAAEAAELIRLETEGSPLAPHDIAALADRAGGNPLFLRELVAMAGEGSPVEELPGSVEAAVTARIDRLSSGHRSLLRRLAVLGETFSDDLLPSVLPEGHPLPDADTWRRLEDFIRPSGPGTLRFDHALIRDAAYEGLPYRLRRELHTRVGQTIERASYPNLEEQAEVLSLHYFAAGRYDAAWLHARVAGDRARDLYANAEAATFYDRALEAARHIGDVPDVVRAELHESLGDVLERLGEYRRAAAAYRAARRLVAGDRVAEARLLWKQGWIRDRAGRFSEAIRWIGRGLRSLEGITGEAAARQRAQLSVWYAAVRQAQGRNREAIRWARRAVDEASQAGERQALAHAYYLLDWALVDTGRGEEASCSQDALAIYRELGDLPGQATVLNNMAGFAYLEGRWDEALERYGEAREASSRAGDAVNAAIPTAGIAEILLEQGHLGAAEELLKEALRVWIAAGHWWGRAYATLNRGRIAARAGDLKGAEALLEEARETFRVGGAAGYVSEVDARIAELRLLQGRPREALDLADRLLAQGGSTTYGPVLHRVRGCALARLGELEAAEEALRSSLGLARDGRASHEVAATLLALIDLAEMRGVPPPDRAGPEAREILDRLRIESPPPSLLADRSATLSA
ncbi:MAG TPA: tetratricopeptide repeat protein, partial [Actinomycetota bacterium]|nr:tetratricopeptide repeat protein [Actinomycetota bacterium]